MKLKNTCSLEEKLDKPGQCIKKQRCHLTDKGPYRQSYDFSSSHVWMWRLVHKEGWAPKNWCLQIVVLEKTLETRLNCKEIKPVHPKWESWLFRIWEKGKPWLFIGRTDAETEVLILWPLDAKSQLIGKDPDAAKIEGKEKGSSEWDGWIASLTPWTWIWANSGRHWRHGEPDTLQSMRSQRAEHDLATEQQQATLMCESH